MYAGVGRITGRGGRGEEVDRGGQAGHHVGQGADAFGRHVPAVALPGEAGPRPAQPPGQGLGQVPEQLAVDGVPERVQHRGSGAEVHLGDERADRLRVLGPLEPTRGAQLLDGDVVEPVGHPGASSAVRAGGVPPYVAPYARHERDAPHRPSGVGELRRRSLAGCGTGRHDGARGGAPGRS